MVGNLGALTRQTQTATSPRSGFVQLTLLIAFFTLYLISNLNPISLQERKNKNTMQHEVTVSLKLVQVYVTDKKGNPVADLKKENFVIYDNGKRQPITEFEKHILYLPAPKTEIQPEPIQESKLPTPRESMSRKFFLLFDFAYNNPRGILKAKKAALHFIDTKLQPSDELGVLSYSAIKSLKLHEYLTIDHTKVRQVVESFGMKDIQGRAENFEGEGFKGASQGEVLPGERDRKQSIHQAANYAHKMTDLAKALRYIPGYKHIILFSSGIPYSLRGRGSEEVIARLNYEDMLKELSASNTAVYTLDTEDLGFKIGVTLRSLGVDSLRNIASSTGGKYFANINEYEKHLEKIQNLTGCYYVLGYYIDENWDGKYHKIEVKVNRPSCKVHAQRGYFNPKSFSEYSRLEKMLHLVDLALNERPTFQTPVRFPMVALPCSIKGKPNLVVFKNTYRKNSRVI